MKPIEILIKEMRAVNWSNSINVNKSTARSYKYLAIKGKLSHERVSYLLELLGYKKIQEEIWEKIK